MRCGVCQNKLIVPKNDSACMVEVLTPTVRGMGSDAKR